MENEDQKKYLVVDVPITIQKQEPDPNLECTMINVPKRPDVPGIKDWKVEPNPMHFGTVVYRPILEAWLSGRVKKMSNRRQKIAEKRWYATHSPEERERLNNEYIKRRFPKLSEVLAPRLIAAFGR